jgi:hypothetical protein
MTWLQPPGYVHVMFSQTWAETTVLASAQAEGPITYLPAPQPGFLADGDDVWSGLATLAQAEALCTTNFSTCVSLSATRERGAQLASARARMCAREEERAHRVRARASACWARVREKTHGGRVCACNRARGRRLRSRKA